MNLGKKEKIFFAIFAIIVAVFLLVAPYFILPQIRKGDTGWLDNNIETTTFLELWEIDTFEGGTASRANFLERTAYMYQDKTKSNYVLVRSLDLEQAKLMLENGSRPDMISFGVGAGDLVSGIAQVIEENFSVRNDLQAGGIKDGKTLAVPWCFGGYLLCGMNDITDLSLSGLQGLNKDLPIIGTGYNYNQPDKALPENEISLIDKTPRTQYEAYESFLRGNEFQVLLGTQRDFYRLNNKVNLGVISNINYRYLNTYTDLVQFIAITTTDTNKIEKATQFIEYLTSAEIQSRLTRIGMFSVDGKTIYSNEYSDFEKALQNKLQVLNVFTSNAQLEEWHKKGE